MPATITISGQLLGRTKPLFTDWRVPLPPDIFDNGKRLTLRDLLTRIVLEEVEAFRTRQEQRQKKNILPPLVWPWMTLVAEQQAVAEALVANLGHRSPKLLIPYLSLLSPSQRSCVARRLSEIQPWDSEICKALFSLVGDASSWVRERVLEALTNCTITQAEATELTSLLTRKSGC
jgi:hypothetical protein